MMRVLIKMAENSNQIRPISQTKSAAIEKDAGPSGLAVAAQMADKAAANYIFADYCQRRSTQTLRTHLAALLLWVTYLEAIQALDALAAQAVNWAFDRLTNMRRNRI